MKRPPADSIFVSEPTLPREAQLYVNEALAANQLTTGPYNARLELALAEAAGTNHASVCSSGTAALHLAIEALGVEPGDRVLVPAMTYVATANAVRQAGAVPEFVDINPATWCMSPAKAAKRAVELQEQGHRVAGVIPVHVYRGHADVDGLQNMASLKDAWILEDACHALGGMAGEDKTGGLADAGVFSFYGSKIITTGEGGAVVCNDAGTRDRVELLRGQGAPVPGVYQHTAHGYNYRLSNVAAAIGVAQIERLEELLAARAAIALRYQARLAGNQALQLQDASAGTANWTYAVAVLDGAGPPATTIRQRLDQQHIETRPFFIPLPALSIYHPGRYRGDRDPDLVDPAEDWPVAFDLARRGICLPLHPNMTPNQVDRVIDALEEALKR